MDIKLTMWTFHSGMNKVVNLAIMDCHKENTEMLTLFLELFQFSPPRSNRE